MEKSFLSQRAGFAKDHKDKTRRDRLKLIHTRMASKVTSLILFSSSAGADQQAGELRDLCWQMLDAVDEITDTKKITGSRVSPAKTAMMRVTL